MRIHGTLTKWSDERGFGFILPAQRTEEVFVHISAFPHDDGRPRVSELVSFEIDTTKDGRTRAVRVQRPGGTRRPARLERPHAHKRAPRRDTGLRNAAASVVLVGAIGTIAWSLLRPTQPAVQPLIEHSTPSAEPAFACDGRTMCSQMRSCEEATYFLKHCPGTRMDGNGDGVPCEQQWCDGAGGNPFREC